MEVRSLNILNQDRQELLKSFLKELSVAEEPNHAESKKYYNRLREIYDHCETTSFAYRHSYDWLTTFILNELMPIEDSLGCLINNLNALCSRLEHKARNELDYTLWKKLHKLKDHICVEHNRNIMFYKACNDKLEEAKALLAEAKKTAAEAKDTSLSATDMKKEIVAILGVFAAIVLTFAGGLSFTASAFESINAGSIYRVSLITTIAGFTLFNILSALTGAIFEIVYSQSDSKMSTSKTGLIKKILTKFQGAKSTNMLFL